MTSFSQRIWSPSNPGRFNQFFAAFRTNINDLLGTTIFRFSFRPDWSNWGTLFGPQMVPLEKRVRFFAPLFRLSRRALVALHKQYRAGWGGHYEVLIPTLVHRLGLTMEDFGGFGAWGRPENVGRHLTNSPQNPGLAPGTFTFAPNSIPRNAKPNQLWHPIKV